ncbi:hypothetical protein [Roseovarius sp. MMSF_3281]|uniref:hypothetical protein n=1 Tax=Roseovarius sp. MMSF_3281 TaxID=3046694 RepID=UPI00273FF827|nr:hypothetical protein [Roseovarius sp. MMSF_3281]
MTLRQLAAIELRVPDSGTEWLDDMIRQAKRDEIAKAALAGMDDWVPWPDGVTSVEAGDPRIDMRKPEAQRSRARWAYHQADAMLKQREGE